MTGKPVGDDIREGKATVLMALAVARSSATDRRTLRALVGSPGMTREDLAHVQGVLENTGARQLVETMITDRHDAAIAALEHGPLPQATRVALREIARAATGRQS